MNLTEAKKATRNGAIAAGISGVLTLLVTTIAMTADADGKLALFNDPFNFFDAAIVFVCAFGIYRHSRLAAIIMFVYYIAARAIYTLETGSSAGLLIAMVMLYFLGKAIFGAFAYHRLQRESNPDYRSVSKLGAVFMGVSALVVTVVIGLGVFSMTGIVPATRVLAGAEVRDADMQKLQEQGVLSADDRVDYFYAQGFLSVLESGNILTDRGVILYYTDDQDQMNSFTIPIDEVVSVELVEAGSALSDSAYLVDTNTPGKWLKLWLSTEQQGDEKFIAELRSRMEQNKLSNVTE